MNDELEPVGWSVVCQALENDFETLAVNSKSSITNWQTHLFSKSLVSKIVC